ncbi:MAG: PQQ-like beta-propeller repeat protein, partial [Planctomycetes bacterium]|nr:PQQ-like beta-propeller repeat protein [Planctomycetota bacterium]
VSRATAFLCTASTGELYALDAATGRALWARPYRSERMVDHEPFVPGDGAAVFLGDIGGTLHAVRAETGEALWTAALAGEKPRVASRPAILPGPAPSLFVPLASGEVVKAAAADGSELWRIPSSTSALAGPGTRVDVQDGLLLLTQGELFAAFLADAEKAPRPLWWVNSRRGGFSRPALRPGTATLLDGNGELVIVDLAKGEAVRRMGPVPGILYGHTPLEVRPGAWVLSCPSGKMALLEETPGGFRLPWTFQAACQVPGAALLAGDLVLFGGADGSVYAIGVE